MAATLEINGLKFSEEDLEILRAQIENFDHIEDLSDEWQAVIAERWPHLLEKLRRRKAS